MSVNVVNLSEIDAFLSELKKKYPHPLLGVFIDYKVKELIIKNHYYIEVPFDSLKEEEKALVKNKPGIYHRALFGSDLFSYVSLECDKVAIEVVKETYKTPQDITNTKSILKMNPRFLKSRNWISEEFQIQELVDSVELRDEGRAMNNCLGQQDANLLEYFYFSLIKNDERYVSFKVRKGDFILIEAKYKNNQRVKSEDQKIIKEFISNKFNIQSDCVTYVKASSPIFYAWSIFISILGTVGLLSYSLAKIQNQSNLALDYIKSNSSTFGWISFTGFVLILVFLVTNHTIPIPKKVRILKTTRLGRFLEMINEF